MPAFDLLSLGGTVLAFVLCLGILGWAANIDRQRPDLDSPAGED